MPYFYRIREKRKNNLTVSDFSSASKLFSEELKPSDVHSLFEGSPYLIQIGNEQQFITYHFSCNTGKNTSANVKLTHL